MKVRIIADNDSEMLNIIKEDGTSVFFGNYTDFDRDASSFYNLLASLDLEVTVEYTPYDKWY